MANRVNVTCCYKCEEREPGCHSTCERYLQQTKELAKTKTKATWSRYGNQAYITGPKKYKSRQKKQL